jgi:hypothetical protein
VIDLIARAFVNQLPHHIYLFAKINSELGGVGIVPNTTISNMFFLGNVADVDPNEDDFNAENAANLVGLTATGADVLENVAITNFDNFDTGVIGDNDINGLNLLGDTVTYGANGAASVTRTADSTMTGTVNVILGDETTFVANVLFVQMDNGDVFVTNLIGSPQLLNNQNIQSIEIASVTVTNASGYFTSQTATNATVVCYASGTVIATQNGACAIEDLSQGDIVMTADNGPKPILWIGSQHLGPRQLENDSKIRPIRICAGALGQNIPATDLVVSPQHRMLVRSKIARKMFDADEVLVAAKQLLMLAGVDIAHDIDEVTYFHFMFDQHEVIYANGAASESLYPGPEALKSVSAEACIEILTLFPEITYINYKALSARTLIQGRKARQLAVRHKNNNIPLVQPALH